MSFCVNFEARGNRAEQFSGTDKRDDHKCDFLEALCLKNHHEISMPMSMLLPLIDTGMMLFEFVI